MHQLIRRLLLLSIRDGVPCRTSITHRRRWRTAPRNDQPVGDPLLANFGSVDRTGKQGGRIDDIAVSDSEPALFTSVMHGRVSSPEQRQRLLSRLRNVFGQRRSGHRIHPANPNIVYVGPAKPTTSNCDVRRWIYKRGWRKTFTKLD